MDFRQIIENEPVEFFNNPRSDRTALPQPDPEY
jgi:hypothetical protein